MKNKIIFGLIALLTGNICFADNYKILDLANCQSIVIGGVKMTKDSVFSDKDVIEWSKDTDNQAIKIYVLDGPKKGETLVISKRAFRMRRASTMYRYVNMIGRGEGDDTEIVVLNKNDNYEFPVDVKSGYEYQLWYGNEFVSLQPKDGKLVLQSQLFVNTREIIDVWVVGREKKSKNTIICYHCYIDLI
jgi:hypothetical protein